PPPPRRPTLFPYTTLFRSDRHRAGPGQVEPVGLGPRDHLRPHLPAHGLAASEVGMRLPRSRVRLLLDLVLEQLRVGRIEVSQHGDRKSTRLNSSHQIISYH